MSKEVASPRNARVARVRRLAQRKHREEEGLFRVEGLQALHLALESGRLPVEVLYCPDLFAGQGAPALLERCRQPGVELTAVSRRVMQGLSSRDAPQGFIAVFAVVDAPLEAVRPRPEDLVLVLDRLQNPGNVGTLLRTADAVGGAVALVLEPCADPHDPTAVRASMGSLFCLPVVRHGEAAALLDVVRRAGLRVIGADPYRGEVWHHHPWDGGAALVLGNEARGVSDDVRPLVDTWVRLPMVGRAESLNVAVTGGVLMYAWAQANWAR
ncbi:MAG: RNA methyltransferase [Candidatus Latescibacterota bacterium]